MFCFKPDKTVASFLEITWKQEDGGAVITIFLKYGKSNGTMLRLEKAFDQVWSGH
jgi:hypothetical protein